MMRETPTSQWRAQVKDRHRAKTVASRDETTTPDAADVTWAQSERRNWIEAARTFDPRASLPEELLVRLVGSTATHAALNVEWGGLLKPLQAAVSAAASTDVGLELTRFSKGSSVLHFRAVQREPVEMLMDGTAVIETPLAQPARKFLDAIEALEAGNDMHSWLNMFDGVEKLTSELDKLHFQADFQWCSRGGDVRRAYLSDRGIQFAKQLAETRETEVPRVITGMVTELRSSGHVKVKAAANKSATAWPVHVDPEVLTSMRLVLGERVSWVVNEVRNEDRLGRLKTVEFVFRDDASALDRGVQTAIPGVEAQLELEAGTETDGS